MNHILIIVLLSGIGFYFWPMLFDTASPTLELSGVEAGKPYRGSMTLNIAVTDESSGVGSLTVQVDADTPQEMELVADGRSATFSLDTAALSDGAHAISVTATDKSWRKNTAQQRLEFDVDNTPPQFQIPLDSLRVGPGKTLGIFVRTNEPVAEITGKFFDREIAFYPIADEKQYRGLVGVNVEQPAKSDSLTLKATDPAGNVAERSFQVEVGATAFERGGYITLSPEKQQLMMDKSKGAEDNAKRANAYAQKESAQLWEGKFIRPTQGALTSPFGKYREYNTGVRRHHLGTDIANVEGTPVYAGNNGIVTLAERLYIYGNAVIIHHGQGVSTSYNHLSEIRVKVGDRVEKGQLIGLMGATGQVTGSHLHWGMVVNGVAVDPAEWTEQDFSPQKE